MTASIFNTCVRAAANLLQPWPLKIVLDNVFQSKDSHGWILASKLAEIRDQLAEKIRADRAEARQGDIFTPEIAAYFRRQLAATLAGHSGAKIRASLRHAEPIHAMPLQVNAKYPQKVPLQSTPPTLLLNLPALPKELQYRIVGRALVLYDPGTDLIVDFMEAALSS